MKLFFNSMLCVAFAASMAFGQIQDGMLSTSSIGKSSGEIAEGPAAACETLDALVAGPLDTQVGSSGITFGAAATVEVIDVGSGDLEINNPNALGDDTFVVMVFIDIETAGISPMADDGMTIGFDYSFTDLNTGRFYSPQAGDQGIIFTRLGDPDLDGDWDVLETDGGGAGVFFDTGVPIALSGRVEFVINDLAMDIFVDGSMIYTGGIIGINGDPGITPGERLTSVVLQTANDFAGFGSEENIDDLSVNTDPCDSVGGTSCMFDIGDINTDGAVDLLDVGPFVDLLTNAGFQCEADIDDNGAVDLLDVTPFVDLLTGG